MRIIICKEVIVVQLIYAHLLCELNLKTPPLMLLYSLIIFIVHFLALYSPQYKQPLNVLFSLYSKMNQDERDDLTQEDTAGLVKGTWTFYLKPVQVITDYLMTGSSKVSSFLALATNLARLEARRRSATWTPTPSYGSREVFTLLNIT